MRFLYELLGYFRYTPKGKKLWGQCGAVQVIGRPPWTSAQRGVEVPVVGISVRRFAVRYYLEVNEKLPDNVGQIIARALTDSAARDITIEGEVTGTLGVMAFVWAAGQPYSALGTGQDVNTFPANGSTPYLIMDEVTETQERSGWRSINMRLSTNPELHG